jgi:hypothetical protein
LRFVVLYSISNINEGASEVLEKGTLLLLFCFKPCLNISKNKSGYILSMSKPFVKDLDISVTITSDSAHF